MACGARMTQCSRILSRTIARPAAAHIATKGLLSRIGVWRGSSLQAMRLPALRDPKQVAEGFSIVSWLRCFSDAQVVLYVAILRHSCNMSIRELDADLNSRKVHSGDRAESTADQNRRFQDQKGFQSPIWCAGGREHRSYSHASNQQCPVAASALKNDG